MSPPRRTARRLVIVDDGQPRRAGRASVEERIHRFTNGWEAAASLRLRRGDLRALDSYKAHGTIIPGSFDEHLDAIAEEWMQRHAAGETVAITAATDEHVDEINYTIRQLRERTGDTDSCTPQW